jgi:hypothetical protein
MKDTYTILETEERGVDEFRVYFRVDAEGIAQFGGSVNIKIAETKASATERINEAAFTQVKARRVIAAEEAQAAAEKEKLAISKQRLEKDLASMTNVEVEIKKPKQKKRQLAPP